jgi:hypothetical protein
MKALLPAVFLCIAAGATAAPVKCVDAKGKILYIDEADVGAQKCQPVTGSTVIVPHDAPSRTPPAAPDTSLEAARSRIAAAEAKLAGAKDRLAEQEAIREGNEKNYARVLERLQPYQDAVDEAQRELDAAKAQR